MNLHRFEMLVSRLQAEKIMLDSEENKEYLPIQGLEAFNKATAELLLGADHTAIKVRAVLSLTLNWRKSIEPWRDFCSSRGWRVLSMLHARAARNIGIEVCRELRETSS